MSVLRSGFAISPVAIDAPELAFLRPFLEGAHSTLVWHVRNGAAVAVDVTLHLTLEHGVAVLPDGQSGRVTVSGNGSGLRPVSIFLKLSATST